jgi:hypothetical protein
MKSIVIGLTAILFAGSAFAQQAPATTPGTDASQPAQTEQSAAPATQAPVQTVNVQREKPKNTTSIVLGAVGAAVLLGTASSGGGDHVSSNLNAQPSSP